MDFELKVKILMVALGSGFVIGMIARFLEYFDYTTPKAILLAIVVFVVANVLCILTLTYPILFFVLLAVCVFFFYDILD